MTNTIRIDTTHELYINLPKTPS